MNNKFNELSIGWSHNDGIFKLFLIKGENDWGEQTDNDIDLFGEAGICGYQCEHEEQVIDHYGALLMLSDLMDNKRREFGISKWTVIQPGSGKNNDIEEE